MHSYLIQVWWTEPFVRLEDEERATDRNRLRLLRRVPAPRKSTTLVASFSILSPSETNTKNKHHPTESLECYFFFNRRYHSFVSGKARSRKSSIDQNTVTKDDHQIGIKVGLCRRKLQATVHEQQAKPVADCIQRERAKESGNCTPHLKFQGRLFSFWSKSFFSTCAFIAAQIQMSELQHRFKCRNALTAKA